MRLALFLQIMTLGVVMTPWAVTPAQHKTIRLFRAGRRLLLGSPYVLPKDASDDQRLDAQHHLFALVTGVPSLAVVGIPRTILDVGCGTGIWCREMAEKWKGATVVGIDYDISRLKQQSRASQIRWQQVNALESLPFISNSFDYVHLRFAATWIPLVQWPTVLAEVVRVTRPGGVVALAEGSMPESESAAYTALCAAFDDVMRSRGLDVHAPLHLASYARQAGLETIEERWFTAGGTPEQQHLLYETTMQGFKSLLPLMQKQLKADDYAAYLTHLADAERATPEVTRRDVVVWGRKPTSV